MHSHAMPPPLTMYGNSYIRAITERPDPEMYVGLPAACTPVQAAQRRLALAVAGLPVCNDLLEVVGGYMRPSDRSIDTLLDLLGIDGVREVFDKLSVPGAGYHISSVRSPRGVRAPDHVCKLIARGWSKEAGDDVELLSYISAMNTGCRLRFKQICLDAGLSPSQACRILRVLADVMTQALHRHCAAGLPALKHLPEFH